MEKILEKIKEFNRIILHGHGRPDGDCIGSQYGLYYILKESFPEKEVYVTGETSEYVAFVGAPTLLKDDELFKDALCICLDCGNSQRLSDNRCFTAKYVIKIDHHPNVEPYGDYVYVDTTAPACAQIITEFYLKFKDELKLTKEAATALYVGINTDTGRFKFDSVNSRTFMAAACLVDHGVDLSYIDNQLSVETLETLKLKGWVLSNFKMTENGFAYVSLNRETIESFGVSDENAAAQVSAISTIEGCPVWALFIEYPGEIRIRLRSRGPAINELAAMYQGGGHPKAAGAKLENWEQLAEFAEKADKLVKEYKISLAK